MSLKELVAELLVLLPKYPEAEVYTSYAGSFNADTIRGVFVHQPLRPDDNIMLSSSRPVPHDSIIISEV